VVEIIVDNLDRKRLTATIETLEQRISERFPDSGLRGVCAELLQVARSIGTDLLYIRRPNWWLRGFIILFVCIILAILVYGLSATESSDEPLTFIELIQIAESGINDVVLIGAAIVFLVSVEVRSKRQRVIEAVNRLRSIAHVIDMHQLTKDPSIVLIGSAPTAHSPRREMAAADLGRYLDYCSEMFALTSKVGFCYVQDFDDPQAVHAINELESLTSDLARKVWQKIMLLPAQPA
jgi:hypothetical protein